MAGWNGSGGASAPKKALPKKAGLAIGKGALAGAIVVALAALGLYLVFGKAASAPTGERQGRKPSAIAEVKPSAVLPTVVAEARVKPSSAGEEVIDGVAIPEKPAIKIRELSPEEWDRLTNRTFKTGTEQLMSWVFSTEVGEMPMPIPKISEEERDNIVGILISKNEIKDSDSEMAAYCKENVEAAKKEMLAYLKQGGDPDEFLQYYFKQLKNAFELRNEVMNQVQEAWDESPEEGAALLEKANEVLEREGIKTINKENFE